MSSSYVALGETLAQEAGEETFRFAGKRILALASFFIGLGCVGLWSSGDKLQLAAPSSIFMVSPTAVSQPSSPVLKPAYSYSIAALPGPTALKNRVVRKIEAVNHGACRMRDVSMAAESAAVAAPVSVATPETDITTETASADAASYKLMASPLVERVSEAKVRDMPGVTGPLGLFDPLGISTKVPEGQLLFYREAELKHGRVCMLAFLGLIVGERHDFIPLLGSGIDAKLPAYLLGTPFVQDTSIAQFWPFALAALFAEEARHEFDRKQNPNALPGDYGWDPLGLKPKDAKALKDLQNKELNNGRLAMFATAGIIAQEMVEGRNILPPPLL